MVSLVIVMLSMMAIAGSVLTLRHLRRNREVDQLFLQLRIHDGLLTDESLAALPIALTVHLPPAPWSPAVVEITGCVPTPELRDGVVRLAKRELSRRGTGVRTAARIAVEPLICPRASGARDAAPAVTPPGMVPHVLIADDDQPSLNGLEAVLTRWGCRVETATDGQIALAKTLALHPSLVITDFAMPRLNGLEVWEVLRRDCPETPVIILTGPYGYLEKPVEVPQLRMLVAKALAPETTREPHAPSRAADLEDVLASCQS